MDVSCVKKKKETTNHILLHCSRAIMLWQLIYVLWSIVGDVILGRRCPYKLAQIFCWEGEEESLENSYFVFMLDHMEEEKYEIVRKY